MILGLSLSNLHRGPKYPSRGGSLRGLWSVNTSEYHVTIKCCVHCTHRRLLVSMCSVNKNIIREFCDSLKDFQISIT